MIDNHNEFYRFKYLGFGDENLSLNVIKEGTIKFTCPLDFNDPFDCQPVSVVDDAVVNAPFFKRAQAEKGLSPARKITERGKMIANLRRATESGDLERAFLKTMGILSLSRTPSDILMWSHYADYHRGFVVGFKYDIEKMSYNSTLSDLIPHPVKYSDERFVRYASKPFSTDCLLLKSSAWKYEQEERVITANEGPGIHPYNKKDLLYCVIAGARIQSDKLKLLKDAVKSASNELNRDVILKQARLSKDKFAIDIIGLT
ncbi:DUF2971 domain-containing protein [Aeromonas dhakensis]|uniref:DUF2971 domain-containing protein n=1 Tax=Aeromonas dhakensis TaxID=196024 RepID=UPI0038D08E6F